MQQTHAPPLNRKLKRRRIHPDCNGSETKCNVQLCAKFSFCPDLCSLRASYQCGPWDLKEILEHHAKKVFSTKKLREDIFQPFTQLGHRHKGWENIRDCLDCRSSSLYFSTHLNTFLQAAREIEACTLRDQPEHGNQKCLAGGADSSGERLCAASRAARRNACRPQPVRR